MNKFNIAAVAAAAVLVSSFFVTHPLVAIVAFAAYMYLAIYGVCKLGVGMANSIMLLMVEKTLDENAANDDPQGGNRAATALFFSFGAIAVMLLLIVMVMNSFYASYASAAATFLGLGMLWLLAIGYQAKRWRDRFGK